mgnify:CR=1 FL=1
MSEVQEFDLDSLKSLEGVSAEERALLDSTISDVRKHLDTILDEASHGYRDTKNLRVIVEDPIKASILGPLSRVQLKNYLHTIWWFVPLLASIGLTTVAHNWLLQSILAIDEYTFMQLLPATLPTLSVTTLAFLDAYLLKNTVLSYVREVHSSWGQLATKKNQGIRIPFSVNSVLLTETGVSRASIPADRGYGELTYLNRDDSVSELLGDVFGVDVEGLDYENMSDEDFIESIESYLSDLRKALRLFKTNTATAVNLRFSQLKELERKLSTQAGGSNYDSGVNGKEYLIDPLLNLRSLEEQIGLEVLSITNLLASIREQMSEHALQIGIDGSKERITGYSNSEPDALLKIEEAIRVDRASIELKVHALTAVLSPLSNIFLPVEVYQAMDPDQDLYPEEDSQAKALGEELVLETEPVKERAKKVSSRQRRQDTSGDVWR